jgi:hypothetical protein
MSRESTSVAPGACPAVRTYFDRPAAASFGAHLTIGRAIEDLAEARAVAEVLELVAEDGAV